MFSQVSRYANLPLKQWTTPDGRQISYVSRRFLPPADQFDLLLLHTVTESDRLDNVTAEYLNDPQQYWRICDANEVMSPFDLTDRVGNKIRITLPQGIPQPKNA